MSENTYRDTNCPAIPDADLGDLASILLPLIQDYYNTDEGKRSYVEWMIKHGKSVE